MIYLDTFNYTFSDMLLHVVLANPSTSTSTPTRDFLLA